MTALKNGINSYTIARYEPLQLNINTANALEHRITNRTQE